MFVLVEAREKVIRANVTQIGAGRDGVIQRLEEALVDLTLC